MEGETPKSRTTHPRHDFLTEQIIAAALDVHRALGPGLLESMYEECLVLELQERGLGLERQKPLCLIYRGKRVDCGYRLDLIIEGRVVVEIKAVKALNELHEAQLLSYLRLSSCPVGLLINFNVALLRNGVKRMALTRRFEEGKC